VWQCPPLNRQLWERLSGIYEPRILGGGGSEESAVKAFKVIEGISLQSSNSKRKKQCKANKWDDCFGWKFVEDYTYRKVVEGNAGGSVRWRQCNGEKGGSKQLWYAVGRTGISWKENVGVPVRWRCSRWKKGGSKQLWWIGCRLSTQKRGVERGEQSGREYKMIIRAIVEKRRRALRVVLCVTCAFKSDVHLQIKSLVVSTEEIVCSATGTNNVSFVCIK
jgi:hypothetical protein